MPTLPGALRLGEVRAVVSAARLLALHRGLDDQTRRLDEVLLLGRARREPLLNLGQHGAGSAKPLRRAGDASILPHQCANRVGAHLRGAAVGEHWHLPAPDRRLGTKRLDRRYIARDSLGENEALQQRVRREPVRTVHAGARDFANSVETFQRRPAAEIGDDAAHHVMRGGRDRYEIPSWIDSSRLADREDAGKSFGESAAELARVEVNPAVSLLAEDRARDDVARRQLREAVALDHEALAGGVEQNRAFAAHGLRDQLQRILGGVEGRRMKLNELHIGEPRARAMSNCETIASGDDRIRRVAVHLTAAAGGEHRDVGDDLDGSTGNAGAHSQTLRALDEEIEYACLLDDTDPIALVHALDECARDLGAGLIAVGVD